MYGLGIASDVGGVGGTLPKKNEWAPKCFEDLIGDEKVQKVAQLHGYLDGFTIRVCQNCRSRWFAPTSDLTA